jgi:hypothetical protein
MHEQSGGTAIGASEPNWILPLGGAAALLVAAGYLATIPLFAAVGAPPNGAEARLAYHAAAGGTWWAIVALSVVTDLLLVPVAIALYVALRRTDQPAMLIATSFTLLFVALDLAVTWPAYGSLISLGREYAGATGAERVALVAAAGAPSAVLGSPLQAFDSILTLSVGILVTGLVMLRGRSRRATNGQSGGTRSRRARDGMGARWFGRAPALAGVATGIAGVASVVETAVTGTVSPLAIAASVLTIAWLALVGIALLRRPPLADMSVS